MATPVALGDVNTLEQDENVLPISTTCSPKSRQSSPKPQSSPSKFQQLSVETGDEPQKTVLSADSRDDNTNTSSLVFSTGSSEDNFSIDRYASLDKSSLESLSIEKLGTEEQMEETTTKEEEPIVSETPRALNDMMEKFDLLKSSSIDEPQQDKMMAKFDELQKSEIATPTMEELPTVDDTEVYRDKRLFEIMSPTNSQEGVEVQDTALDEDAAFASYSQSNSYSSNDMFSDIERFRSAESHFEPTSPDNGAAVTSAYDTDSQTHRVYEQRIMNLMNQLSQLEIEKDELRAQKNDLQSKLNVQHEQDVQDMYQNPYGDPFASPAKAAMPSFLEAATSNLQPSILGSTSMGGLSTSTTTDNASNAELHCELTELRMKNNSLQSDLENSDRVKERLKKILKTVQAEDQQKLDLLTSMTKEVDESKVREASLKKELDACKIRIEGFEIAHKKQTMASSSEDADDSSRPQTGSSKPSSPQRGSRMSFFSAKEEEKPIGDVAMALVISERQNEALEAFNKELETQNASLQKKCDGLMEQYGLKAPKDGDARGNQLYSRYLEMKSSLSSMSVVLEEAQDENLKLSEKVKELETELKQEEKTSDSGDNDVAPIDSLRSIFNSGNSESTSNAITAEQEAALKVLVEKLEVQILGYREAEERHEEIRAQLEKEAAELRQNLEESQSQTQSFANTSEVEQCYEQLEAKIASNKNSELKTEMESLKQAMDAAAEESTKILNKLEHALASTRADLRYERTRYAELHAKHEALLQKIVSEDSKGGLFAENEQLQTRVSSLKKETEELKSELMIKNSKIEKSEKRVAAKHEHALQLNEANASLREGIHKLKEHLSTISEQASKAEANLYSKGEELDSVREKANKLEIERETLQAKVTVLEGSIDGGPDGDKSKKVELVASLAASKMELSLEKERIEKLLVAKKELEVTLRNTKEDLKIQSHIKKQIKSDLDKEIATLKEDLEASKLIVAAANIKMVELTESNRKDTDQLQELLDSTKELLTTEQAKTEGLTTLKTSLESKLETMKQNVDELQSSNAALKEEMEATKKKSTADVPLQFSELEKLLATTQEELNEEEEQVESLEKQVDGLTEQIEELEKCKTELQIALDDVKQEVSTVSEKNKELESRLETSATKDSTTDNEDKPASDVRLWESEMLLGNTKRDLEDALKQNELLMGKVKNLESSVEKSQQTNAQTLRECETHELINREMAENISSLETQLACLVGEKENLLKRTAALARRDQLQKASLMTSNEEIVKLMQTVSDFQGRFETLAEQVEQGQAEKEVQAKEFEEHEAKWVSRKAELEESLTKLQKDCDDIQKNYDELDSKHMKALMKEQSEWQSERVSLTSKIAYLEKIGDYPQQTTDTSADAYYPIRPSMTDRSLLNNRVLELEQEIQLLDVTYGDKNQQHEIASAELKLTKEKLEAYEEELESTRGELHTIVLKSATDRESFNMQVRELEEKLALTKKKMEATKKQRDETKSLLSSTQKELKECEEKLLGRDKQVDELEKKMATELQAAMDKHEELETKHENCLEELESSKALLLEKEEIMRELAKKQVEQKEEELKREMDGKNKEVLTRLADELNEAHIRESSLENSLVNCQQELASCKKKLKSFETQVSEEQFGSGVYKDVIAKLNQSNDNLTAKNKKLTIETEGLKKKISKLRHENEIARVVAGGNNNVSSISHGSNHSNQEEVARENLLMKDLLATSQLSVTEAKNMQKILSSQVEAATKRETKLTKDIVALKARNADMANRLEEQEIELDEFESDFALARNDARKVVEELRSQLSQLEKRNKQLEAASGGLNAIEDLKNKLRQLVLKNKRLEKEIATCKTRERRLESELGLEPRRCR